MISWKEHGMIGLINDTIDNQDIDNLVEWLKTYPRLTKGEMTVKFEEKFAKYIGKAHAVYVNSGSSANLLMLYSLIQDGILNRSDEVIVPNLSWATDVAPLIQLGLKPILCDCNMDDLSIDLSHLMSLVKDHTPKVLLLVAVLGLVPDMNQIVKICTENNIVLLEDVCEALGSEYNGKKLGSFGLMSSFSMYFGHHISTIEGGMICTDDRGLYNILKSIRSHGWSRDLDIDFKKSLKDIWQINEFDDLYTFYYPGFNMRATDLQAFIGISQIDKLEQITKSRESNYNRYNELLNNSYWMPNSHGTVTSNFAYPVIHPKKKEIVAKLQENHIETRPLLCGSMGNQPFYKRLYGKLELENSDIVSENGLYVPNHPDLTYNQIKFITGVINSVV